MDREDLMDLFRRDMSAIEPTQVRQDEDLHPASKRDSKIFKYEHSTFLFKVWMAGRSSAAPAEDVRAMVDEPVGYASASSLERFGESPTDALILFAAPDVHMDPAPLYRHAQRKVLMPCLTWIGSGVNQGIATAKTPFGIFSLLPYSGQGSERAWYVVWQEYQVGAAKTIAEAKEVAERIWKEKLVEALDLRISQYSQAMLPDKLLMRPFQTVDRGSASYKAGWNASLDEIAKLNGDQS